MKNATEHALKRWAAYRLGHLGDVALCTGVLSHLAQSRGWDIIVITRKGLEGLFAHNPFISSVIAVEDKDLPFLPFIALSGRLARAHADRGLLDLHDTPRSRLLSFFWKGPVLRYDKMSLQRRLFLLSHGKFFRERLRADAVPQRYYKALNDRETPPPAALRPRIWMIDEERQTARARLDAACGRNSMPVALHPYAAHALKTWPRERWRSLAKKLEAQSIPWIVVGKGEPLFPGDARDCSNDTSLRETCALLSWCRALATGDSGPMHLAAGVDTPVVALFGPTTREWGFYPQGERDRILERNLSCRPCSLHGNRQCPEQGQCLSDITPEDVIAAIPGPS